MFDAVIVLRRQPPIVVFIIVVVVVSAVEEPLLLLRFVGVTMVLSSSDAVLLLFFLEVRVTVCFFVVGVKGRTNSSASELSEDLPWNNRTLRLGCVPMLAISLVPVLVLPLLPVMGVERFSIIDGDSGNNVMIVLRFTFMLLLCVGNTFKSSLILIR